MFLIMLFICLCATELLVMKIDFDEIFCVFKLLYGLNVQLDRVGGARVLDISYGKTILG